MRLYAVVDARGNVEHVYREESIRDLEEKLEVDYRSSDPLVFDGDLKIAEEQFGPRDSNPVEQASVAEVFRRLSGLSKAIEKDGGVKEQLFYRIDHDKVMKMPLSEAHQRLLPYFLGSNYEDSADMAVNFLSQNSKLEKGAEGLVVGKRRIPSGRAVGLSLFPHAEYLLQLSWVNKMRDASHEQKVKSIIALNEKKKAEAEREGKVFKPRKLPERDDSKVYLLPKVDMNRTLGVCPGSTADCRAICLAFSGKNVMDQPTNAKAERTAALYNEPHAFCRMLLQSIDMHKCMTESMGMERYFVRLNVYSDIPWEYLWPELFQIWKKDVVTFYDYTKIDSNVRSPIGDPYDLTFSWANTNSRSAWQWYREGGRFAVVFLGGKTKAGKSLDLYNLNLEDITFHGKPVVEGKLHDFRPVDPRPAVVGLKWIEPSNRGLLPTPDMSEEEKDEIKRRKEKRGKARDRFIVVVNETPEGLYVAPSSPSMTFKELPTCPPPRPSSGTSTSTRWRTTPPTGSGPWSTRGCRRASPPGPTRRWTPCKTGSLPSSRTPSPPSRR